MTKFSILLALVAGLTVSVVATPMPHPGVVSTEQSDTFDDINSELLLQKAIGTYRDLDFQDIGAADVALVTGLAGVKPQSGANVAVYGGLTTTTLGGSPIMTSRFSGSNFHQFTLKSFYFGCVYAGLPVKCTITLQGELLDHSLYHQNFTFTPGTLATSSGMVQAKMVDISVDTIRFTTSYPKSILGVTEVGSTALDSMSIKLCP